MNALRIVAVAVTLVGLGALGIATAPSVSGQSRSERSDQSRHRSRELAVLAGRGAELGVRISDAKSAGVEIDEVEPDSAAAKAGLKAGDVITAFDGERVRSARQFARLIRETAPGRTVKATISRNDRQQDVEITMAEGRDSAVIFDGDRLRERLTDRFGDLDRLRDLPFNFNFDFDFPGMTSSGRLGVTVNELTDQLASYFGAKTGLLVTSVADGSAAARAGIKAGDVITSINGQQVTSREDLLNSMRESNEEEVTLGIVRDKKEQTLRVKIEPRRPSRSARPA
jgi:serine protease Do